MATPAQIEANRRNAQNSTGPKSAGGKSVVARNAVTHGFYCQHLILPGENEAELQALRSSLYARLQPVDDLEKLFAERVVIAAWKLRRVIAAEQKCLAYNMVTDASEFLYKRLETADKSQKHAASLERAMDKALAELSKLQKNRPDRASVDSPTSNIENKPNRTESNAGPPALAGGFTEQPDQSASMKIQILETNPISATPQTSEDQKTNPAQAPALNDET